MKHELGKVLKCHLQLDGYGEVGLAEFFINPIGDVPLALYDRKTDIEALDRLSRGLADLHPNVLDQMSLGAQEHLGYRLIFGFGKSDKERSVFAAEGGTDRERMFKNLLENSENIRPVIDQVRREIEASPRTRRSLKQINLDRLKVIDTAADWWERYSGYKVPTAEIKDAQPFARFLADLFEVLEIDGSPVTAFRAWLKHIGQSPEDL